MMNRKRTICLTRFLKAFNKYLLISWAIFVLILGVYFFGLSSLFEQGPLQAFAEDEPAISNESDEGVESVDLPPSEPISQDSSTTETADLPPSEPINHAADSVIQESAQQADSNPSDTGQESVTLPHSEPMVDSSSPDVSVVNEPTPAPTPAPIPTPYQPPQIIEREVVREVVRNNNNNNSNNNQSDSNNNNRSTPAPTPSPSPSPSPTPTPTVSLTLVSRTCAANNETTAEFRFTSGSPGIVAFYLDKNGSQAGSASSLDPFIKVNLASGETANFSARVQINAGTFGGSNTVNASANVCASPSPAIIARGGGQVLGLAATPTPIPTPIVRIASPSPAVVISQIVSSPSPQVQVLTSNNVITIPAVQPACPSNSTRVQETDSQIICRVNVTQSQTQAQKQVVLTQPGTVVTGSAAPKVIAQIQTPATQLPNTGLPAAALGFGTLVPLGLGMRKFSKKGLQISPNSVWLEKQLGR